MYPQCIIVVQKMKNYRNYFWVVYILDDAIVSKSNCKRFGKEFLNNYLTFDSCDELIDANYFWGIKHVESSEYKLIDSIVNLKYFNAMNQIDEFEIETILIDCIGSNS